MIVNGALMNRVKKVAHNLLEEMTPNNNRGNDTEQQSWGAETNVWRRQMPSHKNEAVKALIE